MLTPVRLSMVAFGKAHTLTPESRLGRISRGMVSACEDRKDSRSGGISKPSGAEIFIAPRRDKSSRGVRALGSSICAALSCEEQSSGPVKLMLSPSSGGAGATVVEVCL